MTERVLVTGAAGFVGSHLCRRLVAEGSVVVGLDDLSGGTVDNLRDVPEVRLVEADLRDPSAVADAARGCVTIYHQGAKRSVPGSMKDPEETTTVNVLGTLQVLLAAHLESAIVVFASSSSVYGDQDTFPQSERSTLRPRSPYAASKVAGEVMCASFWRSHSVRTTSLRYFNVYGPGQDPASEYAAVIPRFAVAYLTGSQPVVYGDGQQARDFTYIDDVVEANLKAARAPEAGFGRAFNIGGGGEPTSVNDLLAQIAEIVGAEPEPVHAPPREGDVRLSQADVSSARELLGYHPAVSIRDGLRQTVDAFRSGMPVGVPSTR